LRNEGGFFFRVSKSHSGANDEKYPKDEKDLKVSKSANTIFPKLRSLICSEGAKEYSQSKRSAALGNRDTNNIIAWRGFRSSRENREGDWEQKQGKWY
jgi:hypothetical protein